MGLGSIAAVTAALLGSAPLQAARLVTLGALSQADASAQLDAGLNAMNDFDDSLAHRIFTRLLAAQPPVSIAAKAYLYLGVIDFNGLDTARAREEFKHAVEIDPAVEPPMTMSPKAQMVFSEARRAVAVELARPIPAVAGGPAQPPAAAVSAEAPEPEKGSSHALAWTLGAGGVALGVISVVGLVQILNYNSLASKANETKNAESSTVVAPALANAQSWQPWSIALAIGGAALITTAAFVW